METWKHCLRSYQMFGDRAEELHYWLDQYWSMVEGDHTHRRVLHNNYGLYSAMEKFGMWIKPHFIQHMIDDEVEGW